MIKHTILYIRYALAMLFKTGDFRIIPIAVSFYPQWWKDYKTASHSTIENKIPWINYKARIFLKSIIRDDMQVFEWGSGGSTLYFTDHCKTVISIEHDKDWYEVVAQKIQIEKISNVTYFHIAPQSDVIVKYYSRSTAYKECDFSLYVNKINDYPDNSFDLIIVDGRARNFCLVQALAKVKIGGYIMVDNSERSYYTKGCLQLHNKEQWECCIARGPAPFQHAFTQSSFYKRLV